MFNLRVNGIFISQCSVRNQMQNGYPTGSPEIVINDSLLGEFAINDSFIIEIQDTSIPPCPTQNRVWKKVTMSELAQLMVVGKQKK